MSVTAVCEVTRKGGTSREKHGVDFVHSTVPSLMSPRPFPKAQTGPGLVMESPTVDDYRVDFCPVWSRYGPGSLSNLSLRLGSRGVDATMSSR